MHTFLTILGVIAFVVVIALAVIGGLLVIAFGGNDNPFR